MSNIKNIMRVPVSITGKDPNDLSIKCLENNLRLQAEFHYFHIMQVGKLWMAWYYADVEKYPVLKKG